MSLASYFKAKKKNGGDRVKNDVFDDPQISITNSQKDDGCNGETSTNTKDTNPSKTHLITDNAQTASSTSNTSSFTFDFFQNKRNTQNIGDNTQKETKGAVSIFQFQFDLNNDDIHEKKAKKNRRKKKKRKKKTNNNGNLPKSTN